MSLPDAVIAMLATRWAQPVWDTAQIGWFEEDLEDVPLNELVAALNQLRRTRESPGRAAWRPDPVEIRAVVVESRGLFPTPAAAHLTARKYIEVRDWYRANGAASVFPLVHPIACAAADAAGTELEGSFNRAYRDAVGAATKEIQKGRLDEPVIYRPARVCRDHTPPDLTWHSGGWWNSAGVLVADGRGNKIVLPGPARPELTRGLTEETT